MTIGPRGEIIIDTLGDHKDAGYEIRWYCNNPHCNRTLALDLDKAIELWGRDRSAIAQRWGVKCAGCGGKDIGQIGSPPDYRP